MSHAAQNLAAIAPPDPPAPPRLRTKQMVALEAILSGATHTEAAQQAHVSRRTLARWLRCDPDFIAALNLRQAERWNAGEKALCGLLPKAIRAVEQTLESGPPTARLRAASLVFRTLAIGKQPLDPREGYPPTSPASVVGEWRRNQERAAESKKWDDAMAKITGNALSQ